MSSDIYEHRNTFFAPPTLLEKVIATADYLNGLHIWGGVPTHGKSNYIQNLIGDKDYCSQIYVNPYSQEEQEKQTKAYNALVFYEENVDNLHNNGEEIANKLGLKKEIFEAYCLSNRIISYLKFKSLVASYYTTTVGEMNKEWRNLPKHLRK